MVKYYVVGTVNLLLLAIFIFLIFSTPFSPQSFLTLEMIIRDYTPLLIFSLAALINTYFVYLVFFRKKLPIPFSMYAFLTIMTLLWFLILFVGFFFASSPILPLVGLIVSVCIYFYLQKKSKRIALLISGFTIIMFFLAIASGFEEDYCWDKGAILDPTGSRMVKATKEDARALKEFQVTEGLEIGISFRTHMLCHQSFSLSKAVSEKYSPQKTSH